MKAHILVVDDDPRITDLLRRILAYEGYSVAIAASGNEALNRSMEHPPELIVLDLMLPGLDGLEVARRATMCLSLCSRHVTPWLTA
jgi:DNA-binding response OmpR family regulator